jgi:hypothetical protein
MYRFLDGVYKTGGILSQLEMPVIFSYFHSSHFIGFVPGNTDYG